MIDHFVQNHENKVFHYVCSFCLRNFDSSDNLLDHFETQHIALHYACLKCHQEFKSLTDLLPHTLLHKNSKQPTNSPLSQTIAVEKRYLSCSFCSKLFSLPSLLRSHTALHLDAKVYVCHFCEKSFRSKQKFLDHYFNHDNSVKPYGCPACDARLGYSTSVPKHIQMHLRDLGAVTVERKPHLCPKCGKEYRDRASLKRHEAMVHLKIGHLCLQCDRKFSSPHALKQHQHQHTGDFIYECDQCDKRYGNASSLYNHKKSHSQQKFICNICCKSFNLKHHLLRHLNTHTGFGPKSTKKIKKELSKAPVD
ncbi:hypothetical protein HELRODRAFT_106331 [Helobdella robusta]|uniref:C2H2-type domain-containing protein n=1 Tax=Helobdella robusta TaxID=6412 RepID=T1EE21_HELRO|nr:hypothetical protein HELRODRAFT_106331 [Helobdella robusta]ESO01827.1 hypothetical protein HELRODRAFT_106331 [Helobdella robusta]